MKNKTKKVLVNWCETHYYEAEIDVPDNLSHEEEMNWIMNNTDQWGMGWQSPDDIKIDWDNFEISELS